MTAKAPAEKATELATPGVTKKKKKKVRKPKTPTSGGGSMAPKSSAGGDGKWKPGDWACAKCGMHNFRGKDACFRCKYARANSLKAASAESAMAYLKKREEDGSGAVGAAVDAVQHQWLMKHHGMNLVNDACFDVYVPYVKQLDDAHKWQILKAARLAVTRAQRLVDALADTPETAAPTKKKEPPRRDGGGGGGGGGDGSAKKKKKKKKNKSGGGNGGGDEGKAGTPQEKSKKREREEDGGGDKKEHKSKKAKKAKKEKRDKKDKK